MCFDEKDMWSEHKPSHKKRMSILKSIILMSMGNSVLVGGIGTDEKEVTKGQYKFPYSDFAKVHGCSMLGEQDRA